MDLRLLKVIWGQSEIAIVDYLLNLLKNHEVNSFHSVCPAMLRLGF